MKLHAGYFIKCANVIKSWKGPRITLPSAIYQKINEKESLSALFVGGSFSTNGIWKNIWNINTAQNNTSVRNVKKEFSYRKAFNDHKNICCN